MSKFVKILIGFFTVSALVLVISALIFWAITYFTSDAVEAGDNFFQEVKEDNYDKAHSMLSSEFKKSFRQNNLKNFIKSNNLDNISSTSWYKKNIAFGGTAEIEGILETASGSKIPIFMYFVKEEGSWKIYRIEKQVAGFQQSAKPEMPSVPKIESLIRASISDFAGAIKEKDFSQFHSNISQLLKDQSSAESLKDAFEPIWSRENDLSILNKLKPELSTNPVIDTQGILVVKGFYTHGPSKVIFDLEYIKEDTEWKLLGINIKITSSES